MRDFGEVSQLLLAFREASASGAMFKNIADAAREELSKIDAELAEKAIKVQATGIGGMPSEPKAPAAPFPHEEEKPKQTTAPKK